MHQGSCVCDFTAKCLLHDRRDTTFFCTRHQYVTQGADVFGTKISILVVRVRVTTCNTISGTSLHLFKKVSTFMFAKVKVQFTLEQATKAPEVGVVVQLYSFHNIGASWRWVATATSWPLYPRERPGTYCTGGWVGPRAGSGQGWKISPTTGIGSPDHPARSESLVFDSRQNQHIFNSPKGSNRPCGPPRLPVDRYRVLLLGVKGPVRDSPPRSADVKDEWSCTSVLPKTLQCEYRNNLLLVFYQKF